MTNPTLHQLSVTPEQVLQRLDACEGANRRLKRAVLVQTAALLILIAVLCLSCASSRGEADPSNSGVLRVSELVVVDRQGVERVRIGGDLPDAVIKGKRVPRRARAAGILLYDDTGQERGGYVTFSPSGYIAFTLDTRERQVALFAADPVDGVALRLWHGGDGNEIALRADEEGGRIMALRSKKVIFQQPPIASPESTPTCTELRKLRGEMSEAELMAACQERMPEEACRLCLTPQ
jgi:hypothetical protein